MNTTKVSKIATERGWGEINTGGGCTALSKEINQQMSAVIADEGSIPEDDGAPCALELLDGDGSPVVSFSCEDLYQAFAIVDKII